MLSVKGRIKIKMNEQVISEKFKKREFVITDESSQYPQHVLFQLIQDKTSLIDQYKEGDEITVHFNLRGREWTSPTGEVKYFNSLEAWRIEAGQGAAAAPQAAGIEASQEDDLPF
ncbi:MAG: DUF3127 domain-containing protein [Bacteroidetes bacterium]|nr:DUF3127 domain-containing protein [Bacteroidota bacterium]